MIDVLHTANLNRKTLPGFQKNLNAEEWRKTLMESVSKNNLVKIVGMTLAAILIGMVIFFQMNRYTIYKSPTGLAHELDRISGKTWALSGSGKSLLLTMDEKKVNTFELLPEQLSLITGSASYDNFSDKIKCEVYNGSKVYLKSLRIRVTVNSKDGITQIDRAYDIGPGYGLDLAPFSSDTFGAKFGFKITNQHEWSWGIIGGIGLAK